MTGIKPGYVLVHECKELKQIKHEGKTLFVQFVEQSLAFYGLWENALLPSSVLNLKDTLDECVALAAKESPEDWLIVYVSINKVGNTENIEYGVVGKPMFRVNTPMRGIS